MIIVNRQPLNLDKPTTETEKWVVKKYKEIEGLKRPLVIVDPKPISPENLRKKPPKYFDAYAEFFNEETHMKEKWYLCERMEFKNNIPYYPKRKMKMQMKLEFDPKNYQEEYFFFAYIMKKLPMGLMIEDKEKEAMKKNAKRSNEARVTNLIYNELSESDLKLISHSRGIDPEKISVAEIKDSLFEGVITKGDYDEFLEECKDTDYIKLRALVHQSVQKGIIEFVDPQYKVVYKQDKTLIKSLNPINYHRNKVEQLVKYFQSSDAARESFMAAMDGQPVTDDIQALAGQWEEIKNPMVLKKWAKENLNLSFKATDKLEDIREQIREELKVKA